MELPYMEVWVGDEASLTQHLSAEEFGCLERLRRHFWTHGDIPNDDARLIRIAVVDADRWPSIATAIGPLLETGLPKLAAAREGVLKKKQKKSAAGHMGAAARWDKVVEHGNTNAVANGIPNGTSNGIPNAVANADAMATNTISNTEALKKEPLRAGAREGSANAYAQASQSRDIKGDTLPTGSRQHVGDWLVGRGAFPGDPRFDSVVDAILDQQISVAAIDAWIARAA